MKGVVGASIVSIVTESLYDKPIVVFREYVQNAADAIETVSKTDSDNGLFVNIWTSSDGDFEKLYFIDNGTGIDPEQFETIMTSIANSGKRKSKDIGYKGIGRLSGISYCEKIRFVNILDRARDCYQEYYIDCNKYADIRKCESYSDMDFYTLMTRIGCLESNISTAEIKSIIKTNQEMFETRNTGFLVILEGITSVLKSVIDDEHFLDSLGWLLPVPFIPELLESKNQGDEKYKLFRSLSARAENNTSESSSAPARAFNIAFSGKKIFRPLNYDMLRTYLCQSRMEQYAVCMHSFSNRKIEIMSANPFSGIRVYLDNILLCDENELIPALQQYGLIQHGTYEMIQSVRGIGALIYIVDKLSISANARRTFIDVTDEDSIRFLALIGEFVESIYQARYALSKFDSAKKKENTTQEKLDTARTAARQALEKLAMSDISVEIEQEQESFNFSALSPIEQKRYIKSVISRRMNDCIKRYVIQSSDYDPDTCFDDFKTWLSAN